MRYNLFIRCYTGTAKLVSGMSGAYWTREVHEVLWTTESDEATAHEVGQRLVTGGAAIGYWVEQSKR